jgi:NAD(P)-dependent dehydrogenase (short-subunit alcohol dehydrogenase family)/acyl carrier protein
MVARGARHLVLMGRREPSDEAREILSRMEKDGAEIKVVPCDISNEEQISGVFLEMERSLPELRGVVHCAGVLDDGVLLQQTWDRFLKVMAPKVKGAWNLHRLTKGRALDFFVLFSSLASLLGSPGQCNYAAANAFLDALAHHRRALGLPALSINWGPWSEVGMAAALSRERQHRLQNSGINYIEPEKALQILEKLLARQVSPQIGVILTHWARLTLSPSTSRIPPLVADLVGQEPGIPPGAGKRKFSRTNIDEARPDERRGLLQDYLKGMVAGVLGLKIADLDVDETVTQLGLDSIMSIELRNQVEHDMGIIIPMVKFLQGPSVAELADLLLDQFRLENDPAAIRLAGEVPVESGISREQLDREEAKALLEKLPGLTDEQVNQLIENLNRNGKPNA